MTRGPFTTSGSGSGSGSGGTASTSSSAAALFRKRSLSNASAQSRTSSKRAMSAEPGPNVSDTEVEGSLGASRLHIDSNTSSPVSADALPPRYSATAADDDAPPTPPADDDGDVLEPTSLKPPPATQFEMINDYTRSRDVEEGESYFLISRKWFRSWQSYCSGTAMDKDDDPTLEPGHIDNSDITDERGQLKRGVQEGVELEILPSAAWEMLKSWYGVKGKTFERLGIETSGLGSARVEFFPPTFHLFKLIPSSSPSNSTVPLPFPARPTTFSLSSGASLAELKQQAGELFGAQREIRLWRLPESTNQDLTAAWLGGDAFIFADKLSEDGAELVEKGDVTPSSTLFEARLSDESQRLAVEEQDRLGNWLVDAVEILPDLLARRAPPAPSSFFGSQFFARNPNKTQNTAAKPSGGGFLSGITTRARAGHSSGGTPGLTGLQNLGNTCFMNSAIQCMSNTQELQQYFTSGVYRDELNTDNPLGMGGAVAIAFGKLIESLWASGGSSVQPRDFKYAVARFAPQFSGYGQQDSQELLAFLLDGVHEDLNRIKKKPATTAPDWNGGGDQEMVEMANTCWDQYRSRNDSVIVDLFQGQYRSTVVCPDCAKVSITFDPFMYVTTNLPVSKKWRGRVFYVPLDPAHPRREVKLQLPKNSTMRHIKTALQGFFGCKASHLIAVEEYSHKFWKVFTDDEAVSDMSDNDIVVFFELPVAYNTPRPMTHRAERRKTSFQPFPDPDPPVILPILHQKQTTHKQPFSRSSSDLAAHPLVCSFPRAEMMTIEDVYKAVARQYARVTKLGDELIEVVESRLGGAASGSAQAMEVDQDDTPGNEASASNQNERQPLPFTIGVPRARWSDDYIAVDATKSNPDIVPLESRLASSAVQDSPDQSETTLPGSFVMARDDSTDAMTGPSASVQEVPESDTETDAAEKNRQPLVENGDFLVVEWSANAWDYFFDEHHGEESKSLWDDLESFEDPVLAQAKATKGGRPKSITLADCLTEFTKEEKLGEGDEWYCPRCKEHKQATKKVELWKVPDVLVFALKRFSASRWSRDKVDDLVDFPLEGFDMEPFVEGEKVERRLHFANGGSEHEPEPLIYDLYAVDNHYGGLGGGHYTAYAKNYQTGKWYDFDDSRVSPISPESVVTKAAYLLFYRRRTTRPIGAKTVQIIKSALQSRANSRPASPFPPAAAAGSEDVPEEPSTHSALGLSSRFGDQAMSSDAEAEAGSPILGSSRDLSRDGSPWDGNVHEVRLDEGPRDTGMEDIV